LGQQIHNLQIKNKTEPGGNPGRKDIDMSHNIHYIICDEIVNRKGVMADIAEHARSDGDGYSSRFTWHDEIPPYETEEKAREAIKMLDRGWYDDHAVRFFDYSKVEKNKKMAQYEEKISALRIAQREYQEEHSVHRFQAKYIGCPNCGSRLSKEHFRGERCPLCRADLRSKTTLDKLKWYEDKIKELCQKIEAEKIKQKSKAVVKWLIKYEYHS
jgi:ssDNA-binding Zn-finger/Zn-ribbon topoisomerase 1